MNKIFGTDGVRGVANTELTPELAYKIGRAGAFVLTKEFHHRPQIIIGKDTRISGDMLESALVAGMCSVGAIIYIAEVVPTPAIPFLIKKYNLDAGVMISASHNHVRDNGIKFFNKNGYKLSDKIESEIEELLLAEVDNLPRPTVGEVGYKKYATNSTEDFIEFLVSTANGQNLSGLKIVLDCANGATYKIAEEVFRKVGAEIIAICNDPDGININDNCGSTHIENLRKKVLETKADMGFAFDGDGDRCLCIDENGLLVDGDQILSIIGMHLKEKGKLKKDTIVGTVMTNLGLSIMGEKEGISIEKTLVGDRYILEKMIENGYNLGGEQSGHIIMLDYNTTGDGILVALQIAIIVMERNEKFSKVNNFMEVLPQVLANATVLKEKKNDYISNKIIQEKIDELEHKYKNQGRVLIRPSGTEPLVRVMIEGKNIQEISKDAKELAELLKLYC